MTFKINIKAFKTLCLAILSGVLFVSCNDDDDNNNNDDTKSEEISVPDTYEFENVKYSGQTYRIELLDKLVKEVGKAADGNHVKEQDLIDIYENNGVLGSTDKNLSGKVYSNDDQWFRDLFHEIDTLSKDNEGIIKDGKFFSPDGREFTQLIEKGLMGGVLYYQAMSIYLHDLELDDNTNVTDGEGTEQEHHFDEAFGYFGVPVDYASNTKTEGSDYTNSSWFWGKYAIKRNDVLKNRMDIFNAFLEGRTAISNENGSTRDSAVS
ncbi:MAG: DUF4856 domain-containing protein [Flavobacteriales bacterium]